MKYRITMWNPDAEEKSKVVVEKEASQDRITARMFRAAIWHYITRQPFKEAAQESRMVETMWSERVHLFPITIATVGNQVKLSANNDDYTEYLFERLE
jgi:hypothetical protein